MLYRKSFRNKKKATVCLRYALSNDKRSECHIILNKELLRIPRKTGFPEKLSNILQFANYLQFRSIFLIIFYLCVRTMDNSRDHVISTYEYESYWERRECWNIGSL